MPTHPSILIQGTHGAEDPEKSTLPFIVGNVAVTAEQDTTIFLTSEGVRLATRGYADDIQYAQHPPTGRILADFVANGGRIWACGACTGPRGITAEDMVEGATIVTAANLVEALASGASTVAF
ncbi:MAG: DsrE family protein [Actinobacteria bacterium]|nr:DsrE family protein [Actinomycetota bacterium]MBI3256737.1 DsrE family protein [Actinomycetota bacterium]